MSDARKERDLEDLGNYYFNPGAGVPEIIERAYEAGRRAGAEEEREVITDWIDDKIVLALCPCEGHDGERFAARRIRDWVRARSALDSTKPSEGG